MFGFCNKKTRISAHLKGCPLALLTASVVCTPELSGGSSKAWVVSSPGGTLSKPLHHKQRIIMGGVCTIPKKTKRNIVKLNGFIVRHWNLPTHTWIVIANLRSVIFRLAGEWRFNIWSRPKNAPHKLGGFWNPQPSWCIWRTSATLLRKIVAEVGVRPLKLISSCWDPWLIHGSSTSEWQIFSPLNRMLLFEIPNKLKSGRRRSKKKHQPRLSDPPRNSAPRLGFGSGKGSQIARSVKAPERTMEMDFLGEESTNTNCIKMLYYSVKSSP